MAGTPARQQVSRKRPWVAVLLTVLVPGLGHIYLRLWGRALLWVGLSILSSYLFVPDSAVPETFSSEAFMAASRNLGAEAAVVLLAVSLFCMVDAYVMARQINAFVASRDSGGDGETKRCPNCRKELDPDIDFCHWCTTELEESNP